MTQAGDDVPYNVTLGFSATSLAAAQAFVDMMGTTWHDHLRSATTSDLTMVETNCLYALAGNEYALATPVAEAGTGGTGVLPSNCACLVRKNTAFAGRKYRGRMYWPDILAEGDVDINGTIDPSVVSSLQTHFDNMYSDLDGVANTEVKLLHTDGSAGSFIYSFTVQPQIATQRRRMRG